MEYIYKNPFNLESSRSMELSASITAVLLTIPKSKSDDLRLNVVKCFSNPIHKGQDNLRMPARVGVATYAKYWIIS